MWDCGRERGHESRHVSVTGDSSKREHLRGIGQACFHVPAMLPPVGDATIAERNEPAGRWGSAHSFDRNGRRQRGGMRMAPSRRMFCPLK